MTNRPQIISVLAATLSALCWGSATVMSKGALGQIPPIMLLAIQLTGSLVFLWTILLARGVRAGALRDALRIAWLGLLEPGLAFVLGLVGLAETQAGNATLIASSEAIMIAALSALLLRERLSLRFFVLSAVALTGLMLAIGINGVTFGGLRGDGLIALGTLAAAFYIVLSSRVMRDRDPILVVACQQLVAGILALVILPIEMLRGHIVDLGALPISTWALALGSGIVQYALAFSFYLAAMRSMAPSVVGTFLYLTPVVGLAGAVTFLGEKFTGIQLTGAAITVGALVLLNWIGNSKNTSGTKMELARAPKPSASPIKEARL
jgi:drug/metabolite transporter (DMT)-like permease